MDSFYRENILDHYRNPHNFGKLPQADLNSEEGNPLCGDKIRIQIKLTTHPPAGGPQPTTIKDVRFTGDGCAISMASASMLTDKVKGMSIQDVKRLGLEDILSLLGITLTPSRVKCALLALEVLHGALTPCKA